MIQGFFAVGRQSFAKACSLDIYAATAFLVLARGTGPDNVTTSWSANATADRMKTRWSRAKAAITLLEQNALVVRKKKSPLPSYKLEKAGELIWLPNALVDGVGDAASPLGRIRQTHDVMTLRLLVELYAEQNLREDGGISRDVVYATYDRVRMSERGQYVIWGFDRNTTLVTHQTPTTQVHMRRQDDLTEDEKARGINVAVDFFARFTTLESLGLVSEMPTLHEAEDGEPIHPVHPMSDILLEAQLGSSCEAAARRSLSDGQWDLYEKKGWPTSMAPVPRHVGKVALVGIYRLHYRPHTSLTGSWVASSRQVAANAIAQYDNLAPEQDWKAA